MVDRQIYLGRMIKKFKIGILVFALISFAHAPSLFAQEQTNGATWMAMPPLTRTNYVLSTDYATTEETSTRWAGGPLAFPWVLGPGPDFGNYGTPGGRSYIATPAAPRLIGPLTMD